MFAGLESLGGVLRQVRPCVMERDEVVPMRDCGAILLRHQRVGFADDVIAVRQPGGERDYRFTITLKQDGIDRRHQAAFLGLASALVRRSISSLTSSASELLRVQNSWSPRRMIVAHA